VDVSKRARVNLLQGFRLLADPLAPVRSRTPSPPDVDALMVSLEAQFIHDYAVSVMGQPTRTADSDPQWRSLIWGEHVPTATPAIESYPHHMVVSSYAQAPQIVARIERIAPEPLLIQLHDLHGAEQLRVVDFLAGVMYANRGQLVRIGNDAFAASIDPRATDSLPGQVDGQLELDPKGERMESAG
jgi:hypothetical protein